MAAQLADHVVNKAYYLHGSDHPDMSGHGACLHHVLEHYIKVLRSNPRLKRKDAMKAACKALDSFFKRENARGVLSLTQPAERPGIWTVQEVKNWAMKCLRKMIAWLRAHQIVWIEEEMSLSFELDHADGTVQRFNLGRPDLVGYSAKTGRYIVLDYKTTQKELDERISSRVVHQLLKHALGLHVYFKKQTPPQHLLEVETAALYFPVSKTQVSCKARFHHAHNPFELFRRKGKNWRRRQQRYKPLVKNIARARYVPAKR